MRSIISRGKKFVFCVLKFQIHIKVLVTNQCVDRQGYRMLYVISNMFNKNAAWFTQWLYFT